ncbi:MAG: DUF3611 family protein [Scytonema sp. PMC 1069.18]|nr:DUF3611 family protein [Scytonema sp. PMC 1069.18]MEC4884968.1 DUF3611 family protein [Scytonema sp. PMC 1070.18]
METQSEELKVVPDKIERVANVLRFVGWISFWLQLALGAAAGLMVILALTGRNFTQALTPPTPGVGVQTADLGATPGIGISIFWAVCGNLVLLFNLYLSFRLTRFARRLRTINPELHPKKATVMKLLRIGAIASLVGLLLFIFGGGAGLGVLLAKSISQPQGVAIYDPTRIIRALDIFVAMANMTGIAAQFTGTVSFLGLFNWLHHEA